MTTQELKISIADVVQQGFHMGFLRAQASLSPVVIPIRFDNSQISASISTMYSGLTSAMNSAVNSFSAGKRNALHTRAAGRLRA